MLHSIHPDFIRAQLNSCLDRLGRNSIELAMVHQPEFFAVRQLRLDEDPIAVAAAAASLPDRLEVLRERFLTVGQAKVATSAYEAFDLGYLREGVDEVELDRTRLTARAKIAAAAMADAGYVPPRERTDITVLGQEGLGIVHVGAHSMKSAGYISDHDQLISVKLGTVLCGGDLSAPTKVSERYLLDIERKAFAELCRERKSLERMQSLIQTGKILRN